MAVIIIVVIVPSSSCTRHCISSLFNVVARINTQKCIDIVAYVNTIQNRPITSGDNNNNNCCNSRNNFDVNFNRSFSGYRITIHEDNTYTHTVTQTHTEYYRGFTSYNALPKVRCGNVFLFVCVSPLFMPVKIIIPVQK